MNTASDLDYYVDWPTYHHLIERLIVLVDQSGCQFDQILCLARGGLRVGDIFSRVFDLPLAILSTSSYRENSGHLQGDLEIASFITLSHGTLKGRVLLLDDLVDSGETLSGVCQHLVRTYPSIESLKTGVLWYKTCSSVEPDFYVEKLSSDLWIHQPFEAYDGLSAQDLADKAGIVLKV